MNRFVANDMVADGMAVLIQHGPNGPVAIWVGPIREVQEHDMNQADECHVHPDAYARIAAKARETGKGQYLQ